MRLMLGDCLERMNEIEDHSIDMVLCDLPYGTTANEWDVKLPLDELWKQYHRILKEDGSALLFSQPPFTFEVGISNQKEFRHELIWEKTVPQGFLNAKNSPMRYHENILVFCGGKLKYNPQLEITPMRTVRGKNDNWSIGSNYGGDSNKLPHSCKSNVRYPSDILTFSNYFNRHLEQPTHPTQKPIELCEYLIKTYSDHGMVVLDNCMGSGTIGVAAIQTGRDFIGIELNEDYYNMAVERINKARYKAKRTSRLEDFI